MPEENNRSWDDSLISLGLGALVVVVSGILIFNYFSQKGPELASQQGRLPSPTTASVAQQTSPSPSPSIKPIGTSNAIAAALNTPIPTSTQSPAPKATQTAIAKASPAATTSNKPVENKSDSNSHVVNRGETLWGIAEKYYGSGFEWKKIAQANNISSSSVISTGQVLNIPKVEMTSSTATETPQKSVADSKTAQKEDSQVSSQDQISSSTAKVNYVVAQGDNLWKIAQDKCNDPYVWTSIAKQNNLAQPSIIHKGNVLNFSCQK